MNFEKKYKELNINKSSGWNDLKIAKSQLRMIKYFTDLNNHNIKTVLDLGCGDGKLSLMLSDYIEEVHGIDISNTAIEWAKKRVENCKKNIYFTEGNVLNLPYKSKYFDLIIDSFCFHCIIGNDRKVFLKNIKEVISDNGCLVIMSKCGNPNPIEPLE